MNIDSLSTICLILSCIIGIILYILHEKKSRELEVYKTIFPFGEVLDRLTILSIKKTKQQGNEQEVLNLYLPKQIEKKVIKDGNILALIFKLTALNLTQWEMEDRVREEGTAKAALAARENNNLRMKVKNQITKLFGEIPEEKIYKGEKNDSKETK